MKIETLCIKSTEMPDANGSVTPPIYLTTTYERESNGDFGAHGFTYNRLDNPNRRSLEHTLTLMDGGKEAFAFASGLAAVNALLQTLKTGDHILLPDDAYFGVLVLAEDIFSHVGVETTRVNQSDLEAVKGAMRPNTKLVWVESPSNPQLRVVDIAAISQIAKNNGAICAVDNTWATPILQLPLALGADVAMYSTTKYYGGHSDVLGGALVIGENPMLGEKLRKIQKVGGAVPSPFDCWLVSRGIRTMPLRVRAQTESAKRLAFFLQEHSAIEHVFYPGLPSHPQHEIAKKQMTDFGAMLSILVKGDRKKAMEVASKLQLFTHATSLGGVESLIEHRKSIEGDVSSTPDNLLRISVGLEHIDDLLADFEQALQ